MTALLYGAVALLSGVLSVRAWAGAPNEPVRRAFLGLGLAVAAALGAFALSLMPGLEGLRPLYVLTWMLVPALALATFDRMLPGDPCWRRVERQLAWVSVGAVFATAWFQFFFFVHEPKNSPPLLVGGVFAYAAWTSVFWRLWEAHAATRLRLDRQRLRILVALLVVGVLLTLMEQLGRHGTQFDGVHSGFSSRGAALQGTVPPLSAAAIALAMYYVYKTIVLYRLIDLREMAARLTALAVLATILVLMNGLTVFWVEALVEHPLHSAYQFFLASVGFLALYDLLSGRVAQATTRLFNRRGVRLIDAVQALEVELPRCISQPEVAEALVHRLYASGRVSSVALYLWDAPREAYRCVGRRGGPAGGNLQWVAANPFTSGFTRGVRWYSRSALAGWTHADGERGQIHALMQAMDADFSLPLRAGGAVMGWVHLSEEEVFGGLSTDELARLGGVIQLAAGMLENAAEMTAREERQRLSALGAMAAGLAHEIRNPLAGIKGAAQYLQHTSVEPGAADMLEVVVEEADRLNRVVSHFLEYARPLALDPQPLAMTPLLERVAAILRAQGLAPGVDVLLSGAPCEVCGDRERLTQVLLNLAQNALQAMPHGGVLRLEARSGEGEFAEVFVSDTGVGMDDAQIQQLFTPFFTTKQGGTGLGLAICQRIVEAHRGRMGVASTLGQGTTFTVRLPRCARDHLGQEPLR